MDYLRTGLIFVHLMVFAFAITTLYRSDFRLLFSRPSEAETHTMGQHMLLSLIILWVTGLGVIWVDTRFDYDTIINSPKIVMKLSCVVVLTLNAILIHFVAFKKLKQDILSKADMLMMSLVGAVSTTSWTFAAFLGIAKPLTKHLNQADWFALYALALTGAGAVAMALTPMIQRNWSANSKVTQTENENESAAAEAIAAA